MKKILYHKTYVSWFSGFLQIVYLMFTWLAYKFAWFSSLHFNLKVTFVTSKKKDDGGMYFNL